MEEKQFSRSAVIMAYHRAHHAMHDTPRIFNDFLAHHLVPEEARSIIEYHMAEALKLYDPERAASFPDQATAIARMMRALAAPSMVFSRAQYTEDSLEQAAGQGVRQYVILGAGFDTFAFRRPEMLEKLQVFEVDHPTTQAFKRQRIAEAGWEQPANLHFVPVDFEQESLAAALTRSSYDPQSLSLFSWLGVTYYLTREAVFDTLRAMAEIAPAGSAVIFDYLDTDAFIPGKAAKRVQRMLGEAQFLGEPMKTGFNPSIITTELASFSLRLHENLSPTDIQERYFQGRTDGYYACEHQHFAWAVVE